MRAILLTALALAGCAAEPRPAPAPAHAPVATARLDTGTLPPPTQCVALVREISGVPLRGDAGGWWEAAAKSGFHRGGRPEVGAVLVLKPSGKMVYGHVAVVRQVVSAREVRVTHSNWGGDPETRRMVHDSMPVIDVSPNNDWSETRFLNPGSGGYGRVYPAYGFIYGGHNGV